MSCCCCFPPYASFTSFSFCFPSSLFPFISSAIFFPFSSFLKMFNWMLITLQCCIVSTLQQGDSAMMDGRLLQLCLTPYDAMDHHSLPSSSVCGILQARILQWVAMPFSGDLLDPRGLHPCLLHWQVGSLPLVPPGKP